MLIIWEDQVLKLKLGKYLNWHHLKQVSLCFHMTRDSSFSTENF